MKSKDSDEYASKIFMTFIRIINHLSFQDPDIQRKIYS